MENKSISAIDPYDSLPDSTTIPFTTGTSVKTIGYISSGNTIIMPNGVFTTGGIGTTTTISYPFSSYKIEMLDFSENIDYSKLSILELIIEGLTLINKL